jgi:hypothetical protein
MGHIFWNERIKLIDSGEMVEVLAIGDSWFHYPMNNLVTPLHEALERPTLYAIGENGARADELCAGHWLASFRSMLADYPTIELVAISAGGNDFAGIGDLDARILRPDCTGAPSADACWRPGQPDGVFADVANAYRILIAEVAAARPGATVLLHNYDYAIPDGKAVLGLRSWLKRPMDNCRVPLPGAPLGGIRRDIVRALIDHFTLCLDDLLTPVGTSGRPHVDLVWSAGTLADDGWANELHPRPGGFTRLVNQCWAGPARAALGLP